MGLNPMNELLPTTGQVKRTLKMMDTGIKFEVVLVSPRLNE
jgi:hypothetical protein